MFALGASHGGGGSGPPPEPRTALRATALVTLRPPPRAFARWSRAHRPFLPRAVRRLAAHWATLLGVTRGLQVAATERTRSPPRVLPAPPADPRPRQQLRPEPPPDCSAEQPPP